MTRPDSLDPRELMVRAVEASRRAPAAKFDVSPSCVVSWYSVGARRARWRPTRLAAAGAPSSSTTPSWSTRCWRRPPTAPSPNSRPGLRPMASRPAPCLTSWASAPPGGRVSAVAASSRDRVIGRSAELAFRASLAQPAPKVDQRRAFRSAPAAGPSRRSALLEGGQLPEYRTAPWRRPSGGRPGVSRSVAAPPRRAAPSWSMAAPDSCPADASGNLGARGSAAPCATQAWRPSCLRSWVSGRVLRHWP